MTTNWFALPAFNTNELTASSVWGLCSSPPRRPWTALAAALFLASFASGIPNTVLLQLLAPEGQTEGFVGDGDIHPWVADDRAAIQIIIRNSRFRREEGEVKITILIIFSKDLERNERWEDWKWSGGEWGSGSVCWGVFRVLSFHSIRGCICVHTSVCIC